MKVGVIAVGSPSLDKDVTLAQFASEPLAESSLGKLLLELANEAVWSDEYTVYAYLARNRPYLTIEHPAFLEGSMIILDEGPDATIDGVKKLVLAHIDALLKTLQKQSALLQLKSASLNDAQSHIYRTVAVEAVVAKHPEADGCRLFAPYGGGDFTCFTLGHGFGHTVFVARGDCPEYSGGIVQIDMPGDEWIRLERANQYERFWAELAKSFAACELKIPKDNLYLQKTFVIEVDCAYHANEVLFLRRDIYERISVTFDVDSLPTKVAVVAEEVT